MLEWVKSTVKDMRKGKAVRRKARTRLEEERAEKKAKAYLEAERARLMAKSETELLVETLMTLRSWESRYEDLKGRFEIMERNVEEVAEGILDLEFGITSLDPNALDT